MRIGLEIHVALPTRTKLFCSCSCEAEEANTSICPVCMGFPGAKPLLNEEAVRAALGIANALHCKTRDRISFMRKVYFYPDLPKSFQITQTEGAVGREGYVDMENGKRVRIRRVQIEEDPSKIVREDNYTLLDFNRCGTPLTEIVTEPDIGDEQELWSFLREMRSILYYLGVDIEKEMKSDLNISISDVRVEIKNITGIKNLMEAAKYEAARQARVLEKGGKIARETRAYNEKRKLTESSREKETEEEYGYLFEPDLAIFDIKGMEYRKAVYSSDLAKAYGSDYGAKAETIKELIMFDRYALSVMDSFKGKYPMQSIINAVEKAAKYGHSDMPIAMYEKLLGLIAKDAVITKELMADLSAGKDVGVSFSEASDADLDSAILKFVASRPEVISDLSRNAKVFNYVVGNIAKEMRLHPKRVTERLQALLSAGKLK